MAYIGEEEINSIRAQADIVDIISDYLSLQPKGKNYVALCPFHNDHSPSLVVSKERQIFNCFTCRTGGNVFTFVMKYENVSFVEAVEIVAKKIGYNLKISHHEWGNNVSKKEYEMYNIATKFYQNNINTEVGAGARKYLNNRGIDATIIKEFNLGLALPKKDVLYQLLKQKGFDLNNLEKMGLVNKSGTEVFDTFQNRIMIPVSNMQGQVVAFTGRIFNNEDTAKYINTKETPIYKKSSILFNFYNAKNSIKNAHEIIIVEGNMDAIMLSARGIKNVVALMGVAISNEQIKEIKKLKANVILMLDNDSAGESATLDVGEKLVINGLETRVVRLNGAKDPDEYIRQFGLESLINNLKQAPKYLDFKLNYLKAGKDLQNIPDVVKYVKEVLSSLSNYDDLTKEMVLTKLSENYHIDKDILKKNLNLSQSKKILNETSSPVTKFKTKYDIAASSILYAMMNDSKYIRIYKENLGYLKKKIERIIASEIVYYNSSNKMMNLADFLTYIQSKEDIYPYVMEIINDNSNIELSTIEFNKWLTVIIKELKKDEIRDLKQQIQQEMDINKKMEMLAKLTELKKEV